MKALLALPPPDLPEPSPKPLSPDWRTLSDAFLANYRGATKRTYRDAWNRFLAFNGVDLEAPVTAVPDEDAILAFRDSLLDAGRSPHTVNCYLAAVRAFYRFLHRYARKALRTGQLTAQRAGELQLLIEGALEVGKVRTSSHTGRLATTIEQSRELLTSIPTGTPTDIRDRAIIALLLGCGLRRIEIVRALREDLIHRSGKLVLRIQQKGHQAKDAWVVIWPAVERIIRPWLTKSPFKRPSDPIFPSLSKRDTGSPLTPRSLSRIVRKRLDAIGLGDYSTHSLRHAFATIALASDGVDLRDVQHALGHSQVTTTERYVHAIDRLLGRPEKAVNDTLFAPLDEDE